MEHNELSGTVERVVYQNEENGFAVFILQLNRTISTTVRGHAPILHDGEHVTVRGSWTMHPKFGKQFEATHCSTTVPTSIVGLQKYLSSGLIKGIGPVYAEKMVKHFGTAVLDIIDQEPERLREIPGIGPKKIETIIAAWQDKKEISKIMVFLQDKGISTAYATKIYKKYGALSIQVVVENPYRLADEIWGVGFKSADKIALHMGFQKESLKRITAGILYCLNTVAESGSLYMQVHQLKEQTVTLLDIDATVCAPTLKNALHNLYNEGKIKLITHNELHFIGLAPFYYAEKNVAECIQKLLAYPPSFIFDLDAVYQSLRTSHEIDLHEQQQEGIMTCLQHKVTVITGGPGTGKTTLIKKLLTILDMNKRSYKLASPTGRAAKRITEGTGRPAKTIHRLLEIDPSTMQFSRNQQNALELDFLIIDEASMLDIFLANAVLRALPHHAHVVFIGDIDQLPSVGPGSFLKDIIASTIVPCVRLTKIFRQAQDSMIIQNAYRINQGEFPISDSSNARRDFIFIKEEDPLQLPIHLKRIFSIGLRTYGITPQNAMVLVPMNRGTAGTQKLNSDLQEILNPHTSEHSVSYAGTVYKTGDQVMQIRNNYDKLVFNGDIGTIESIDLSEKKLIVAYPEHMVEYEFNELDELVLAYAISIHKSQGSEYSAVIIPIFMQHFTLLQRNLIYTAITRAKKLCIFIGQPKAIAMAIKNNKEQKRITFLPEYLTSTLTCR